MNDMDWSILSKLEKERRISKLSAVLFISQPALTYRINKIESFFDSKLFVRSNTGFHPTPQGQIIIKYAKNMLRELDNVREEIYKVEREIKDTIYIGAGNAVAANLLSEFLPPFLTVYPEIDVKLTTGFTSELSKKLTNNEIQIAFLRENIKWGHYKRMINTENIYLVSKTPVQLKDLPKLPKISYKTNPSLREVIDQWWRQNFEDRPNISMKVDNTETCLEIVKAGLGYAILPGLCLKSQPEPLLTTLLFNEENAPLERQTWMYCTEEADKFNSVRKFLDYMSANSSI